ncbi:Hermansky-Pudlak syndrome 3 protein isoform X3 [Zootermopsis nevadensis]|uniref:Hermansky-Pudlak syndrome 3 protein isoform X3 n=1 Tax=Zootermopsis nevadensis TaxID=136037 RepID=UPI000B8E62CE|nr:Hermansky-Pudlak syndrome 3 protein isoform X3 [Zootermopsis nevadensis]XP_021913118.1 Hermansky-Pudlak syndrome 3 protein isoform X3 [Zootermopsis nevadensis]
MMEKKRMVRVISVHHFVSQDIHTCEDPVTAATAPPNYLLLALPQHVVEVRDLSKGGGVSFSFPTVDQAQQMLHCCNGNYVATLEVKQNRQGKECSYARVYANWDVPSAVQQPMRARIAGRVTPSSAQSGPPSLEMIELPLKKAPSVIACCQTTGNLLLAFHKTLTLYHFRVCTRDISRLRFIDFEESGVFVDLSFSPTSLSLAEDIIACMADKYVHVFRLGPGAKTADQSQESTDRHANGNKNNNIDSHIDWEEVLRGDCNTDSKLHSSSFPLRVDLPSIVADKVTSCPGSPSGVMYRHIPFQVAPPNMSAVVWCTSPAATPWAAKSEVLHLLQLQITAPQLGSSAKQTYSSACDEFRSLVLKPLYARKEPGNTKAVTVINPMHSKYYGDLVSTVCLVVTQQEGYLYHFNMRDVQEPSRLQQAACVTVYPFTAPVTAVAMERFVLHALTETGLETYTLRAGHHFISALDPAGNLTACPPADDPVCLVGLRPFLGVERLLLADSYLVLLACSEESSSSSQDSHCSGGWTLYSLTLPCPAALYNDILTVGSAHRWSSPATYRHLLCEGHVILRTAIATVTWKPGTTEALPCSDSEEFTRQRDELYRESCALLADSYIMCDDEADWKLAAPFYKMAALTPVEVVNRVKKFELPPDLSAERKNQGLMSYLRECLLQLNQAPGDTLFSPAVPNFAHTLLDLFEQYDPAQVSTLVLNSSLLRDCATDRVLAIMKKQLSARAAPAASDALALVLLCIQRGSPEQAVAVLDSLTPSSLISILSDNPILLLERQCPASTRGSSSTSLSDGGDSTPSFSELASVLMDSKPAVLAVVLADFVTALQFATLREILQVFLEYIPSRIGIAGSAASDVLQKFLEKYFAWYFGDVTAQNLASCDAPTAEALKILVRSYLSDLRWHDAKTSGKKKLRSGEPEEPRRKLNPDKTGSSWENQSDTKVLFEESRSAFLAKMPPYSADLSKRLLSLQEGAEFALEDGGSARQEDADCDSLFKLQCLLCSGKLPQDCAIEVRQFAQTHPRLHGNLSLQVLCMPVLEAANVLLGFCPQALLRFTKDRFSGEAEWKWLLLMLHRKVQTLGDETLLKPFYLQVTRDVMTYLAQTLPVEDVCRVLPPGGDDLYRSYVQICQQAGHANHIRALIMATGQQLLTTLNL